MKLRGESGSMPARSGGGMAGGSSAAAKRARSNSAAAAKAVAPKKPKGPVKVAKLVPAKKTSTGAIKINTNPKPVVVSPKKSAPEMSNADIKKFNSFIDKLVAQQKAANK